MSESRLAGIDFEDWSAQELVNYVIKKGGIDVGNGEDELYVRLFEENNLDGAIAHKIDDRHLKEMGMTQVGDRLKFMDALSLFKKAKLYQLSDKIIWEGQDPLYWSGYDKAMHTCCGLCPCYEDEPTKYKLTAAALDILTPFDNPKCCFIRWDRCCCFGSDIKYNIDHIDLSNVNDVDLKGVPPPTCQRFCCCGITQEHVRILAKTGDEDVVKVLRLPGGKGQDIARKVKNQCELLQRMERS